MGVFGRSCFKKCAWYAQKTCKWALLVMKRFRLHTHGTGQPARTGLSPVRSEVPGPRAVWNFTWLLVIVTHFVLLLNAGTTGRRLNGKSCWLGRGTPDCLASYKAGRWLLGQSIIKNEIESKFKNSSKLQHPEYLTIGQERRMFRPQMWAGGVGVVKPTILVLPIVDANANCRCECDEGSF